MKARETLLTNGLVFDPKNRVFGERMDICIRSGKVVESVSSAAKRIDLGGRVVMPGGVDIHTHITGSKVNLARIMRPEDVRQRPAPRTQITRSTTGNTVPNVYRIGYEYALMGYTTVVEAAVPPLKARHTHEELSSIPILDKASLVLMGNNWMVMRYLKEGRQDLLTAYAAWLIQATKAYGIKLVNPGGTEAWGWGRGLSGIRDEVPRFEVTPAEIITGLMEANESLRLPTSIHLHPNGLGIPGNFETTTETISLAEKLQPRADRSQSLHLVHLQFHSYGGESWKDFSSRAADIVRTLSSSPNVTADAGAVLFGWSTTMTADGPFEYELQRLTHMKWTNFDVEVETGAGIVPHFYSRKSPVSVVQWCVGLELLLLSTDCGVFLTTDSPNGAPFYRYPELIQLLMNRRYRDSVIDKLPAVVNECSLPSIEREYTLDEICRITRTETARALGLESKGHLGPGADADIAVYDLDPDQKRDLRRAFSRAYMVFKDGEVVVKEGRIVATPIGRTLWSKPQVEPSEELERDLREAFSFYTVQLDNYAVGEEYLARSHPIETKGGIT